MNRERKYRFTSPTAVHYDEQGNRVKVGEVVSMTPERFSRLRDRFEPLEASSLAKMRGQTISFAEVENPASPPNDFESWNDYTEETPWGTIVSDVRDFDRDQVRAVLVSERLGRNRPSIIRASQDRMRKLDEERPEASESEEDLEEDPEEDEEEDLEEEEENE